MWALRALHGSVYFSSPGTMQKWRYHARAWNRQWNRQHQEKAERVAEIFVIWHKKKKKKPKQTKRKKCLKPLPKQISFKEGLLDSVTPTLPLWSFACSVFCRTGQITSICFFTSICLYCFILLNKSSNCTGYCKKFQQSPVRTKYSSLTEIKKICILYKSYKELIFLI